MTLFFVSNIGFAWGVVGGAVTSPHNVPMMGIGYATWFLIAVDLLRIT